MSFLKHLNQRPIAYYPIYRQITGSTTAGILLSQLMYWFSKKNKFNKTDADIMVETMLTPNELRGAKDKIKKLDFIKISREGIPAKTYYEIDWDLYETCLVKFAETVSLNSRNCDSENSKSITKTTTKTTTKNKKNNKKKIFLELLNSAFKAKKILRYKDKINISKIDNKFLDSANLKELAEAYASYVQRNKNMSARLAKWLLAWQDGAVQELEYANNSFGSNSPEPGSIGWMMQQQEQMQEVQDARILD